jgi:hypothetical protein
MKKNKNKTKQNNKLLKSILTFIRISGQNNLKTYMPYINNAHIQLLYHIKVKYRSKMD